MKKIFPFVIFVLLMSVAVFVIAIFIWAVTFRAGPIKKVSEIYVFDFYDKEKISINLNATNYAVLGDYNTFNYDGTLTDILQSANAMNTEKTAYKTEIVNDVLLITKVSDNKTSYCAIKKIADNRYFITNMAAGLKNIADRFLFPYHFFSADLSVENDLYLQFSQGETIKTNYNYYSWKSFYEKLSRPEIKFDDKTKKVNLGNLSIKFIGDYEIGFEV